VCNTQFNKLCLLNSYQWLCWIVHFICSVYLLSGKFWEFLQLYLLTNSISRVLKDQIFTQLVKKLPAISWQSRVLYHVHMILPLALILMYVNPIYNPWPLSSRSISILSCCLSIVVLHDVIPSSFRTKTCIYILLLPHACCLPFLSHRLDLFILITWWLWSIRLHSFTLSPSQLQVLPYFPALQFVFPLCESPTLTLIILQQDYSCVQLSFMFLDRGRKKEYFGLRHNKQSFAISFHIKQLGT
jgi:hypothetical protein